MCGRFTLTINAETLKAAFDLGDIPAEVTPRYNIAPTQSIAVVTDAEQRDVEMFRWGLIPSWAKEPSIGSRLINARAETVAEKPSFRAAFAKRRCLIPADGFYEWERKDGSGKRATPYYFQLASGEPFMIAGLWEAWYPSPNSEPMMTCTIITTEANEVVAPIHDRSPVMLVGDRMWAWLDTEATPAQLNDLLRPLPHDLMRGYAVSTQVNKPANEGAGLIQPA